MASNNIRRYRIEFTGIVQGVGFRPFVYKTAKRLSLNGWVENRGSGVVIDIEGKEANVTEFIHSVRTACPANTVIADAHVDPQPVCGYSDFMIRISGMETNAAGFLPPDLAVCESCMGEFNTPGAKRFRYPFISCTDCGPRYSIIGGLPYDRENTAMSVFKLCGQCAAEYANPLDRRFHAQTNCCPECGPALKLLGAGGNIIQTPDPALEASRLIRQGKIIAVKGIGGYHLCCSAEDPAIVQRLRKLKNRPHKPLAVMARDLEAVRKLCLVSEKEEEILTGRKKPILLLQKKGTGILPGIAPNQKRLGVMLPYAPLHPLLFSAGMDYLVMTSGNKSGSPICYRESDALTSLQDVAEYLLSHDREISVPVDDAVVRVVNEDELLVRCGRGYAPLTLPVDSGHEILAAGAEQKSSVCLTRNGYAAVSQYIGDLQDYKTYKAYVRLTEHFKSLFDAQPQIIAHDLNPDSLSTGYAKAQNGRKIAIQHHHAHLAGCMAEHKLSGEVIGIIFDGTGLGTDSAVWGGEFFVGSLSGFIRAGHLQYVTLQGGDSVVREPWRCAASYLLALGRDPREYLPDIDPVRLDAVGTALANGINCFPSSSMGRFFDCIAALCGFQAEISYDAQAAIELENLIEEEIQDYYPYGIHHTGDGLLLEYDGILKGVLEDIKKQVPRPVVSARFHNTVSEAAAACAGKIRENTGLNQVVLSGGVFENTCLLRRLVKTLRALDFYVYYNRLTPANDGGISFGQAAAAGAIMKEDGYVSCDSGQGDEHQRRSCGGGDHGRQKKREYPFD